MVIRVILDLRYSNDTFVQHNIHAPDNSGNCPYEYKWCQDTPQLALPQFLVGTVFMYIGFLCHML